MKYIKTFETLINKLFIDHTNDVNIGDKVICIDDNQSLDHIKCDYVYKITNIAKFNEINDQYQLEDVILWWDASRFRTGTPEEIKELESKMTANKYNL